MLALAGEAASDSFARFVRERRAGTKVGQFLAFGPGRIAYELQMFEVPLAPGADPQMKPQLYPLAQRQFSLHRLGDRLDRLLAGRQSPQEPESDSVLQLGVEFQCHRYARLNQFRSRQFRRCSRAR